MFDTDYDGIGQLTVVTFKQSGFVKGTDEGKLVKMSSNDTVALPADGDNFIGMVRTIEKGHTAVSLNGAVEVGYSGSAPVVGRSRLIANATGGVKVGASTDKEYLVVRVNTTTSKVVFFL